MLAEEVRKERAPSVQYVFFDKEKIRHGFRQGLADIRNASPVDSATAYHAFSLTKTVTAVAVLTLVEQGRLSLQDSVKHYLPELDLPASMTLRHLLSHTSGLPNPIPIAWIHLHAEHADFDPKLFFDPILSKAVADCDPPGSKFRYSNLGYVLLGRVIEKVSGVRYETFVEDQILGGMGLGPEELGFGLGKSGRLAKGYHPRNSFSMFLLGFMLDKDKYMAEPEGAWRPFKDVHVNGAPYGGLIGTSDALVRYGQAMLGSRGGHVSESVLAKLFEEGRLKNGKLTGMALGWFRGECNGHPYVCHAGGGGGYYMELRLYPSLGAGSFVAFNHSGFSDARFLDQVDKLHLQEASGDRKNRP